jgi:hypothetical protein
MKGMIFPVKPESETARLRILFVGNSHTYLHHMPQMVAYLAQRSDASIRIDTGQVVGEGVGLNWHAENRQSLAQITSHPWDYVVLQERSGGPLEDPASMLDAARRLDRLIRSRGARTVFFMTWARRDRQDTQAAIADAYMKISRELDAHLAPVGLAWQQACADLPGLDLYHRDGRHAGAVGAYLAAAVFVLLFTGAVPGSLPADIVIDSRKKVALSASTARRLQQIATDQLSIAGSPITSPAGRPSID